MARVPSPTSGVMRSPVSLSWECAGAAAGVVGAVLPHPLTTNANTKVAAATPNFLTGSFCQAGPRGPNWRLTGRPDSLRKRC